MLVVIIARRPEAEQCRNGHYDTTAATDDPADLSRGGCVIVEMLQCFAASHAIKDAAPEWEAGQIAENDGDARRTANVQRRFQCGVDPECPKPARFDPRGELPQADRSVEHPPALPHLDHLGKNQAESMLMTRPEHFGLRPPLVRTGCSQLRVRFYHRRRAVARA